MTKAVIRPDYFSGPAMTEDFGDFGMILKATDAGIVIMDPNVLDPISKADYWVFDDTVNWRFTLASEELLHSLDQNHEREIVFLSRRSSQQIVERAGRVRFSRLNTGGSSAAKKAFIAQRQAHGQSVVYFGDCERESALAATAMFALMVADKHHRANVSTPIVFLSPDLWKFSSRHSLCEKRNARVKSAFAVAAIPNAVAIAAAVFLNSPALVSVAMTTLGAVTWYHRASRLLRQTAGR